jgi:hypothetical protein
MRAPQLVIDNQELAMGDLAVVEFPWQRARAATKAREQFPCAPSWFFWWAAREIYFELGGKRIDELPAGQQHKYRGQW